LPVKYKNILYSIFALSIVSHAVQYFQNRSFWFNEAGRALNFIYLSIHELIDRTANMTVFKSYAINFKDRLGLGKVNHFTSIEGVPMYKDHEYELVSVYNNTTDQDHDAMAHMVLFLRDKNYKKRD